ncbi:palindromic element RPE2 domain-containing protein [Candidatus Tisiphia endosymbiont of Ptychoptera albimana]|uniref:palindromic element RPE2 domain-containing protein n=1 Tax=Candidatus Tisiphia endosymbiont of Ptychoptera albimana TaxID=3066260 RepID=UPI001E16CD94|nr:palindromic element RPE2 domain-containing protein [Rickettsia endosymbiont of Sericostoma sp. HW-2014]
MVTFLLNFLYIVNSGEFGARSDGATPISNRRATSDNVPNFSSIDYNRFLSSTNSYCHYFCSILIFLLVYYTFVNS